MTLAEVKISSGLWDVAAEYLRGRADVLDTEEPTTSEVAAIRRRMADDLRDLASDYARRSEVLWPITVPDTPAEIVELALRSRIEGLLRELALAQLRVEQLERELVAAGVMDPELAP